MHNLLIWRNLPAIYSLLQRMLKCLWDSSEGLEGFFAWNRLKIFLLLKIAGSESFTRWLIWGNSASASARDSARDSTRDSTRDTTSTSTQELGKMGKFLHPHACKCIKCNFFLPSSSVWMSPAPHIVSTIEATFLFKQMTIHMFPPPSQNFETKAKSNH